MLMAKPRGDAVGLAAALLSDLTVADFLVGTVVDLLAMLTAFPEENALHHAAHKNNYSCLRFIYINLSTF